MVEEDCACKFFPALKIRYMKYHNDPCLVLILVIIALILKNHQLYSL
uniref:Uncharacterized protein n=1 Tax=Manihot esculenta TaxID=3983 RepID=A0A2C9VUN2_MANES